MKFTNIFQSLGNKIGKETKKLQINLKRKKEIKIIKEEYLSRLSHHELVQIYKVYLGE